MKKIKVLLISFLFIFVIGLTSCGGKDESSSLEESTSQVESPIIIYALNGGKLDSRVLTGIEEGQDVSDLLGTPTKNGYDFNGWYTDEALSERFDGIMVAGSLNLFAKYDPKAYVLTLNYNSSETENENVNIKYGQTIDAVIPERSNAAFTGWFYDQEFILPFDKNVTVSGNLTLYARWQFKENTTIYVSKDGKSTNAGTEASPLDIYTAVRFAGPNVKINIKKDTYSLTTKVVLPVFGSGKYAKLVDINGNGSLFDFSGMGLDGSARGFQINGDFFHIKDLSIKGAGDNGMLIGGSNNIVENCVFYENRDTGLQISRYSSEQVDFSTWPANNLVLNCTSYDNCDPSGENADGFAAKLTCGNNIFDGCIAYSNSDDGYDLYPKADTGTIGTTIIRNCVAFNNGKLTDESITTNGDGNGFKLGGSNMAGHVIVENCAAWGNQCHGFTDNSNPGTIILKNCTSINNGVKAGTHDNFDLARNSAKANNCYYGLLSFMTDTGVSADNIRGSSAYSYFRFAFANKDTIVTNKYYKFDDYYEANSGFQSASGTETDDLSADIFKSIANPSVTADIHSTLRNEDGSVNLGDFLQIADADLLTYCEGEAIGANLSLSSNDSYKNANYYINEDLENVNGDDVNAVAVNQAQVTLYAPYCEKGVFKNFALPYRVNGNVSISWSSSDKTIIDPNSIIFANTAVITRGLVDKTVTLTATLSCGDTSAQKEFTFVVKALSPNIGTISNSFDQVFYDENNHQDEMSIIVVKDLNDPTGRIMEYNTDYTVEQTIYNSAGNVVEDFVSSGEYTVTLTIKLVGHDVSQSLSYNVKKLSAAMNATFKEIQSNYIIDGKVTVEGEADTKDSTVFILAIPANAKAPTTEQIYSGQYTDKIAHKSFSLIDTKFSFQLDVGSSVQLCDIYGVVMRNDWTSEWEVKYNILISKASMHSIKNVSAMLNISTKEEFYAMATTQDESPKAYALTQNLDFSGFEWTPAADSYVFAGYLEGNNYKISNLHIEAPTLPGIFVNITNGIVKNLVIENSSVKQTLTATTRGCGMLAGFANGCEIENIKLINITSEGYEGIGGLIGTINSGKNVISQISLINNSENTIKFVSRYAGGIIGGILNDKGPSTNILTNIISQTKIQTTGSGTIAGGIVGRYKNEQGSLSIKNAYYTGVLSATKYCGGAIGSIDKSTTYATLENIVVWITEFPLYHSDNRTLLGNTNSDDFTNSTNTISLETYPAGQDNCESSYSIPAIASIADWWFSIAQFDSNYFEIKDNFPILK